MYDGDKERKCGPDGYWIGKEPRCRRRKLQHSLFTNEYTDYHKYYAHILIQKAARIQRIPAMATARSLWAKMGTLQAIPAKMVMMYMEVIP